jgi:hypothetical protein
MLPTLSEPREGEVDKHDNGKDNRGDQGQWQKDNDLSDLGSKTVHCGVKPTHQICCFSYLVAHRHHTFNTGGQRIKFRGL